jgi:hypothetical protein
MGNKKWIVGASVAIAMIAFTGSVGLLSLSSLKRVPIEGITVAIVGGKGEQVAIINGQPHPPWAHSHILLASLAYDPPTVTIEEFRVAYSPFSDAHVYSQWPLALGKGLLPGDYLVRCWGEHGYRKIGRLLKARDGKLTFVGEL